MNNEILKIRPFNRVIRRFCSKKSRWRSVVGLEIHAQIQSESKLFSCSSTNFSSPINTNVALFDASIPGTLPVLNKRCVEAGILTGLSLNCNVNLVSMFDRKHYFYGDMPSGYQITQQRHPLASNGSLKFSVFTQGIHKKPYVKEVKIKQIQLEQDSGKSLHCEEHSLVDLNRAGVGLMEVVFEPNLNDGEEAAALVKELSNILKKIRTCSCKMEEGALRVDANVSINKPGEPLGIRTEIKNICSVRNVASAVQYEIERQINLKETGGEIINETRSWDAVKKKTVSMRDKEEKQDYRYMPEPNLPPLHLKNGPIGYGSIDIEKLQKTIPELPAQTRDRLTGELGLNSDQAIHLVNDEKLLEIFEDSIKFKKVTPKLLANILIYEFLNVLYSFEMKLNDFSNGSEFLAETVYMLENRKINRETLKYLIGEFLKGNITEKVEQVVQERNLYQINDEKTLVKICENVINENPNLVEIYMKGKMKAYKMLMKQISEDTNQLADMAKCDEILKKLLKQRL